MKSSNRSMSIGFIYGILGLLVLFAPFGVIYFRYSIIGGPWFYLIALVWGLSTTGVSSSIQLEIGLWHSVLSITLSIFRIIFAYAVVRSYKGDFARKWTYLAGLLSITPMMILAALAASYETTFWFVGPIPILLIVGFYLLRQSN